MHQRGVLLEPAARLELLNLSTRRPAPNTGAALEQALAVLYDQPALYGQMREDRVPGGSRDNPLALAQRVLSFTQPQLALRIGRSLLPVLERYEPRGSYRITDANLRIAEAYEAIDHHSDAARHFDAAIANAEKDRHGYILRSTITAGLNFHLRHANFARAEQLARRQIALLPASRTSDIPELVQATTSLAVAQAGRGTTRQAEENFQLALRLGERVARVPPATVDAYARFLENNNRRQDATRLRARYGRPNN
jgi:hypothetical protein